MKSGIRRHGPSRGAEVGTLPPPTALLGHVRIVAGRSGSVEVSVGSGCTRVTLAGEIDTDLAEDLRAATTRAEGPGLPIEVDARAVTFMDSTGGAFLARLAIRNSTRVRLVGPPPEVRFLLEVTRIGDLLDVVDEPAATDHCDGCPTT
ncbi:STAS domain-containing protein [Cellulomonas fimi]|uniref:STAS domain-containing protein n=1 Tax=Cellulomonas fimi TaxID=1708 RepID=A0A7Y0QGH0_CELFI|nr:STAS domain-containing protein [Cellulomonas fimi]NMR19083.1 STAS domain-containing protein [Cellulomonas fimi]